MTNPGLVVLAGGGHSHALVLKKWAMRPNQRPARSIILVNRNSTTLYSGMVPGLIAGLYEKEEMAIDLRALSERAGVAFAEAEIIGVDPLEKLLHLKGRPSLQYSLLSLNVGAVSRCSAKGIAIKPLEPALAYLAKQSPDDQQPFRVIGAGAAGIEVVLALRKRWPKRRLQLQRRDGQLTRAVSDVLRKAQIELVNSKSSWTGPSLLCTGSCGADWLKNSGMPINRDGRIITDEYLRVVGVERIFASGDCAVIRGTNRPASGVWAVRAAKPLSQNLEATCRMSSLRRWRPQQHALQLIGNAKGEAWAEWHDWRSPTTFLMWELKKIIDKRFIKKLTSSKMADKEQMPCRGCAAKLPSEPLTSALKRVGVSSQAEDAAEIGRNSNWLQSIDGFPAIVSDPWLNGRLTTLHACSDLWASGAHVSSAMTTVILPKIEAEEQKELLVQTIGGIRSALDEQGANLIGGHTMESRSTPPKTPALGIEIVVSVNGVPERNLRKTGIKSGDALLLSRPLGTGILLAAAMMGETKTSELDDLMVEIKRSQHKLVDYLQIRQSEIHACTDITGFGLLGHLSEMLGTNNDIALRLDGSAIPIYKGALRLAKKGIASTLAPKNRAAWRLLNGKVRLENSNTGVLPEILVDPQTCGPLLVACQHQAAEELIKTKNWRKIGEAE